MKSTGVLRRIDDLGRIVIPKEIRKKLKIKNGESLEICINDDAVIIDVREADEYTTGHIENAVNIPVSNISSVDYNKDTVIIVYCASGIRSANAAKALIEAGYTNVYNLDGGLINWGFELVEE